MPTYRPFTILILAILLILGAWLPEAHAGCRIALYVKNPGQDALYVMNYVKDSRAKSRGGIWRGLQNGEWFHWKFEFSLLPGQRKGATYTASFGCKIRRRYVISYRCKNKDSGQKFYTYYPSATTWTRNTTITVSLNKCG